MTKEYNWRKNYDWTDKNDHPVEDEFQPKVLKDQVVKFYKKPKMISLKPGGRKIKSLGVIELDKPLFPVNKENVLLKGMTINGKRLSETLREVE
tara:strand:+ start:257 stop:538 length:282 start_codon:yes stop_codon:yes gene_type:complete